MIKKSFIFEFWVLGFVRKKKGVEGFWGLLERNEREYGANVVVFGDC